MEISFCATASSHRVHICIMWMRFLAEISPRHQARPETKKKKSFFIVIWKSPRMILEKGKFIMHNGDNFYVSVSVFAHEFGLTMRHPSMEIASWSQINDSLTKRNINYDSIWDIDEEGKRIGIRATVFVRTRHTFSSGLLCGEKKHRRTQKNFHFN